MKFGLRFMYCWLKSNWDFPTDDEQISCAFRLYRFWASGFSLEKLGDLRTRAFFEFRVCVDAQ